MLFPSNFGIVVNGQKSIRLDDVEIGYIFQYSTYEDKKNAKLVDLTIFTYHILGFKGTNINLKNICSVLLYC